MTTIEAFLKDVKPDTQEGNLAEAYRQALGDFESRQSDLLKCLRAEKTGKGLMPVFSPEAENLMPGFQEAESRMAAIKDDIEKFLALTEGEASLAGLVDRLNRHRRTLQNVELEARNIRERAVRRSPEMTPLEAESQEVVQAAFDKRDRVQAELQPAITELEGRLSAAKAILERY